MNSLKKILAIVFVLVCFNSCLAQERAFRKIDSLQTEIVRLQDATKNIESKIAKSEAAESANVRRIDTLVNANNNSSSKSQTAGIILLIGLFLDIVGATLLAGADLSKEVEPVKSGRVEYSAGDLAMSDDVKDGIMTYYGFLGCFILTIGFCLQFTGSIILLSLPMVWVAVFILMAALISFLIIYLLARQSLSQSFGEKMRITLHNTKVIFWYPIKTKLVNKRKVICEMCHKSLLFKDAEIWYKQEINIPEFPDLHPPYGFYLGHAECIKKQYPEEIEVEDWMPPHPVHKHNAADFYQNHLEKMYQWNEKRVKKQREKWKRNKDSPDQAEVNLRKLRLILSKKVA
jgi:hypothetical protein